MDLKIFNFCSTDLHCIW